MLEKKHAIGMLAIRNLFMLNKLLYKNKYIVYKIK